MTSSIANTENYGTDTCQYRCHLDRYPGIQYTGIGGPSFVPKHLSLEHFFYAACGVAEFPTS